MKLKLPLAAKLFFLIFALVIAMAVATNIIYQRGFHQILVERSLHDLEQETAFFRYPLNGSFSKLSTNINLLSRLPAVPGLVRAHLNNGIDPKDNATMGQWMNRFAAISEEMLRTNPDYLRIRLIAVAEGGPRELLRVARTNDRIERADEKELQQFGGSPIVRHLLNLPRGMTYLSPIQLSREDGRIALPHILTVRAGIPVFTEDGTVFGAITIAADFGSILNEMQRQIPSRSTLFITNTVGDYLVHPDLKALYATDLGHDRRILQDYPKLLEVMEDPQQTRIILLPSRNNKNDKVLAFRKYIYDSANPRDYLGIAVEAPYQDILGETDDIQRQGIILAGVVALLGLMTSIFFMRQLIQPLNQIARAVVSYRDGQKNATLPIDSPDEIGLVAREFATLVNQKNEEDWIKGHLVAISEKIIGARDIKIFSELLIHSICTASDAQIGVLYLTTGLTRKSPEAEHDTLWFLAAYGCAEESACPTSMRIGEGLVGQCARDQEVKVVTDLPENYLRISSAVGSMSPRHLLILPVVFENSLLGVIELGALQPFSPSTRTLLDQLLFTVGVLVNSIAAGMRTEELLDELKNQQAELQASNEELEEKTAALEEQNAQIASQAAQLTQHQCRLNEKARELERSSRYKSEFLANMSHELRTPLNSLLILARGLSQNEEGNLTAEQVEEARVIHNGGLELLSLINDILDLSKVEAGKIAIRPEDIDLGAAAKKLYQQFQPIAQEAGLNFHLRLDENLSQIVHTDGQRLEQILKNLLSNAFKFTRAGSVTLDIHPAKNEAMKGRAPAEAQIAFSVIDTGIGIEQSKLEEIFQAFQQEDGSIDRHYGGTGLGLTIARKLAHLLGGEIDVSSEKGRGSTFTLFLPPSHGVAQQAAPPALKEAQATRALTTRPKSPLQTFIADDRHLIAEGDKVLLIIEDDADFATTLMAIARKRGYKCLAAGDGKSGLLLSAEQPVTAILLDMRLPDVDGIRVLDHLKHDLATRHIPVHIISGLEIADAMVPLRKGAVGYLMKPVQQEELDAAFRQIESVLQSRLKRVLVVEDDPSTQTAIHSLLKNKTIEIVAAGSGNAALAQIEVAHFDCIILDLKLPDMSGFEWLKALERRGAPQTPPIIVYTARDLSEAETRVLSEYTGSIVIKGASSADRLLDEVTLFLHSIETTLSQDQQEVIRMQHDPDQALQERTVLLVDDDLRNTFALSKLLKKHGMQVVIADNGQMALERLEENRAIELVIMDIMMPVMDGYQAIRAIRASGSWRELPIIALTARAMPEEQEHCIKAGANDYLVKPVDTERLLTLLRLWLFKQERAV